MRGNADKLRRVRPGDAVRADQQNIFVGVARAVLRMRGTNGIRVHVDREIITISGPAPVERTLLEAVITNAPPADVPIMPADCVYNVAVVGRAGAALVEALPRFGRPIRSTGGPAGKGEMAIYPAKVNDPCYVRIYIDETGERRSGLWILTEAIAGAQCGGEELTLQDLVLAMVRAELVALGIKEGPKEETEPDVVPTGGVTAAATGGVSDAGDTSAAP